MGCGKPGTEAILILHDTHCSQNMEKTACSLTLYTFYIAHFHHDESAEM